MIWRVPPAAMVLIVAVAVGLALLGASLPGGTHFYKFGVAESVAAGDVGEVIWSAFGAADKNPFPAAAGSLTVVSSSVNDTAAGSGCRNVEFEGLQEDDNGDKVRLRNSSDLNGTTPVAVADDVFRINRAVCTSGGANNANNDGAIDFKIGTTIIAQIPAGIGQTEMAFFSTGSRETGSLFRFHGSMLAGSGSSPSGIIKMWKKYYNGPWHVFVMPLVVEPVAGHQEVRFIGDGTSMSAATDYRITLHAFTGTAATITAGFDFTVLR